MFWGVSEVFECLKPGDKAVVMGEVSLCKSQSISVGVSGTPNNETPLW